MGKRPVFVINHDDLLQQTRRMCAKSRRAREKERMAKVERIQELKEKVEEARKQVIALRNNKTSPEFLAAKNALAAARLALQQAADDSDPWLSSVHSDVNKMMTVSAKHRAKMATAPQKFLERIQQEKLKEAQKCAVRKKHSKEWDPSIQAGKTIMRKFVALGPSNPSLLRPEGTRFSGTKPKVPWRAVPQGLLFGYTPPPRRGRRHTVGATLGISGQLSRAGHRSRGSRGSDATGASHGGGGGRPASAARSRGHGGSSRNATAKALPPRPAWKAADGVSRVFSYPAYNRPQTAHERAQAKLMITPDRQLFKASRAGKEAWRPVRTLSRPFSMPPHTVSKPASRASRGPRSQTDASSYFDGA